MYFGLYQIPSRHPQAGAFVQLAPAPDLFDRLAAWLRRIIR